MTGVGAEVPPKPHSSTSLLKGGASWVRKILPNVRVHSYMMLHTIAVATPNCAYADSRANHALLILGTVNIVPVVYGTTRRS